MCVSLLNTGKTITITKTVMKQTLDCKKYILLSVVVFPGADWVGHYYLTTGAKHQNCHYYLTTGTKSNNRGKTSPLSTTLQSNIPPSPSDRRAVIRVANMITYNCICISLVFDPNDIAFLREVRLGEKSCIFGAK